ncbi:exo-alpha-sialidase [Hymenobacter ginsengisoli]|uniref:Exo-alpha-sialidase n=1 Tax=Hymenobacter ginsengisoli TaxID=1051626 RepID=A0ABP8QCK2_9BACT|nr:MULTISPECIES: sialidase family protein [unclassified Hymenobacter]MBO2031387.1 exo-alpha-sialidase [Hymenobacter sp. BT559]
MNKLFFLIALALPTPLLAQQTWTIAKQELLFTAPPFRQCHASTLVEVAKNKFLVACFGGSQESKPDVAIWLTAFDKNGISPPRQMADGVVRDTLRYPAWNPVLFRPRGGDLLLFYKVGPNPREWWGIVKSSPDNGRTWSAARRLPPGVLGPIKNKPVQLADGTILAPSSVEEASGHWTVHLEKSTDGGQTWQLIPVDNTSVLDVIQPSILTYPHGRLQLLCRSKQGKLVQAWSADNGATWGPLTQTALLNPNSGTDAVTLKNGTQLLVYNPDVPGKDWFNGRSQLRVAQSADGKSWHDVAVLENGTTEEYSYPAIIQAQDGLVHITYTYNRQNIKHVVLKSE